VWQFLPPSLTVGQAHKVAFVPANTSQLESFLSDSMDVVVPEVKVWKPDQWKNKALGPELLSTFMASNPRVAAVLQAFQADKTHNLLAMKEALGDLNEVSEDVFYMWTKSGLGQVLRIAGSESTCPCSGTEAAFLKYDTSLRGWVAELRELHAHSQKFTQNDDDELDAVKDLCPDGDWREGVRPTMFPVVSKWVSQSYPELYFLSDKIKFYHAPGTDKDNCGTRIKLHHLCIYFGNGYHIRANPELADKAGLLREDLPLEAFQKLQFAVEITCDNGLGKLTTLGGALCVIPFMPSAMTIDLDVHSEDDNENNSYLPFRNSHPDAVPPVEERGPNTAVLPAGFQSGMTAHGAPEGGYVPKP
jgi:hypothetical protein